MHQCSMKWSQRVESNHPRPGMSRLPRRSASLRKGASESNRARRFQRPRCAPALPTMEIPVGPAPTSSRVAIWCFVCFGLGITMDGERGIEPRPTRSERDVLPLHQSPMIGPSGSTRTTGLPHIRRVLCQLSYARILNGGPAVTRTPSISINSRTLCPLSYRSVNGRGGRNRTSDLLVPNQARFRLRYTSKWVRRESNPGWSP